MQAHDSVAMQEMAEESVAQYLGETVKLVRLEKTRDTPLVRHQACFLFFLWFFCHFLCLFWRPAKNIHLLVENLANTEAFFFKLTNTPDSANRVQQCVTTWTTW